MNVKLIHITPDAEKHIAYCARVSNPANQDNENIEKLLAYCAREGHWSIYEMASLCVEVTTSRALAAQIIRHKSLNFQEFSQRYQQVSTNETYKARRQDKKNRQNSIDDMAEDVCNWFAKAQEDVWNVASKLYQEGLEKNIAKEQMRFLLPMSSTTRLYIHGNIRSFIHYIQVRTEKSTQLEHREIALEIKRIFCEQLPIIAKALNWVD